MPSDDPDSRGRRGGRAHPLGSAYPTRRGVLGVGMAGAAALALAACDIRLQDDAPSLPLLERKSVPDEAALIRAQRATLALGQQAGRVPDPPASVTRIGALHGQQSSVLRARLTGTGVPGHVIDQPADASASPTTSSPAVSAPATATQAALAAGEATTTAMLLGDLTTVTAANRTLLTSVVAACGAAADELGAPVTWPAGDPLPGAAAAALLDETRSVGWAFQVVAAQSNGDLRAASLAAVVTMAAREAELATMAGSAATQPALGYVLPFPVTSPEAAGRLATEVMTRLVAAGLGPLPLVPVGSPAVTTLVRLQASAVSMARGWGVTPGPFPGMAYP